MKIFLFFLQILKKICDHPVLLTQKAAENLLEGMDSMLCQNDVEVMEELISNVAYRQGLEDSSCKLNFILSLLVSVLPPKIDQKTDYVFVCGAWISTVIYIWLNLVT